jgi:tRNA(adenine34) deaminase
MDLALKTAENAGKAGEVPIGCVIVSYEVIATAGNRTLTDRDPTAHAEILAIRQAAEAVGTERRSIATSMSPWSPVPCARARFRSPGSAALLRRRRSQGRRRGFGVRFFAQPTCHHVPEVYSAVGETEAATLLKEFFKVRR